MIREIHFQSVTVNVIRIGKQQFLVEPSGRPICRCRSIQDICGPLAESAINHWRWRSATQRLLSRWSGDFKRHQQTPWERRCQSLVASFRFRQRSPESKPRTRQIFEKYSTANWPDAIKRLWQQGHNHFRRHCRDGWVRWSHTVSNNHNKRKGGRYGR